MSSATLWQGFSIRWQHLISIIIIMYIMFCCIKKIGQSFICWAVRPPFQSNSSTV